MAVYGVVGAVAAFLERHRAKPSVADLAVGFSRELRSRGKPKRGRKADKRFFDELSGNE